MMESPRLVRQFRIWLPAAVAALLVAPAGPAAQQKQAAEQKPAARQKPDAPVKPVLSVFKTSTCGCCAKWVDHMNANGFETKVQDVEHLDEVKRKLGVPLELGSCHTAQVGRYLVEGHIPARTVHRLLKERPTTIVGIAVPGMPAGSPGMEVPGGYRQPYAILTFDRSGRTTVYERH